MTSGLRPPGFWRAAPFILVVLVIVCTLNVLTQVHEAHLVGLRRSVWEPVIWEATSAVTEFAASYLIWRALLLAPPGGGGWARFVCIQAIGTVLFSVVHVAGMWTLRALVYGLLGGHYRVPWKEWLYEYPKDVLAYIGFAAVLWLAPRVLVSLAGVAQRPAPMLRDALFDIQDGGRILRIPLANILAVHAAGNYVEFLLRDDRRPLMRAPLARIEAQLGPAGFTRTHRSWLVNDEAVREIKPAGSGDYRLVLTGGAEAPLSRRFPQALERLRRAS